MTADVSDSMRADVWPVVLDTDIGTNIDDVLALAYLLREPRCELLGVTTVHGDVLSRARIASTVCRALGREDVPIHCGAVNPLVLEPTRFDAPQKCVLARWSHRSDFESATAVSFLRDAIRSRPGRVTLLSIGPMTNVARLFEFDPDVAGLLKRVVCMGGVYFCEPAGYGRTEWNVSADPHAAAKVLAADVAEVCLVGLDVTTRCRMSSAEVQSRFGAAGLGILADLAAVWGSQREEMIFHDALAAAVVFERALCGWHRGRVSVHLSPTEPAGLTRFENEAGECHHSVAFDVDVERFVEHYFGTVVGG